MKPPLPPLGHLDATGALAMPAGQWPERIATGDLLARVREIHHRPQDWEEGDLAERLWRFHHYRLERMAVAQLDADEWSIEGAMVDDYACMDTVAPPIVVDGTICSIIDGTHRLNAAIARGDDTIWAYVGVET